MPLPRDDPWAGYARTIVEITRPGEPHLAVRGAPRGERGRWPWPLTDAVHILTAWDPGNQLLGERENRHRQVELETELRGLGPPAWWRAVGVDPVSRHREEGVAVQGLAEPVLLQLGAQFGQDAIFSWSPIEWTIVACTGERRVVLGWSAAET